jgi:hypothetical protein
VPGAAFHEGGCAKCSRIQDTALATLHARLRLSDLSDTTADVRTQQANQDFIDNEGGKEFGVVRASEQVEQASHGIDDWRRLNGQRRT